MYPAARQLVQQIRSIGTTPVFFVPYLMKLTPLVALSEQLEIPPDFLSFIGSFSLQILACEVWVFLRN